MLGVNKNSACTFHIRWNELVTFQGQPKRLHKLRPIKTAYYPFLEVGLEKFFDSHL